MGPEAPTKFKMTYSS